MQQLQSYVPDAHPLVQRSDWHYNDCDSSYHGERYCMACGTGDFSRELDDTVGCTQEDTVCAF
ncbi:hypothetical protein [Citrobacter farmeri]|uniref:putative zinc ribbon protein n=1 Tax=Citrobacter farmeri TaxID=67824 RepID=UPI003B980F88